MPSLLQWVDGTFVTQIENPNDIDIVTFLDHNTIEKNRLLLNDFGVRGAWIKFGVDAYIQEVFPANHPNHFFFKSDELYWTHKFGQTRRDSNGRRNKKGFLEIIYLFCYNGKCKAIPPDGSH